LETSSHIRELLKKFAAGKCSKEETEQLIHYLSKNGDERWGVMPDVEEIKRLSDTEKLSNDDRERIYEALQPKIQTSKKKRFYKKYYRAAAMIALLLSVGIVVRVLLNKPNLEAFDPHSEHITLVNEKGEVQIIDPEAVKIINTAAGTADQNRTTMVFSGSRNDTKLVYNIIRVPYGKTFRIVLSDGTAVDLNAGTSVTFPVNFIESEPNRNVKMIGEAFFDVTKDMKHPFVVHTGEVDVHVLGTAFNVSNYPESKTSDIVLVRGAVTLTGNDNKQMSSFDPVMLSPGEKGTFHRESGRVDKQQVLTDIYTAWLDGKMVFRNTSFDNILIMLERKFNVKIINHNSEIASRVFNATFKENKVETILDYFKVSEGITYTISGDTIIIN